MTKNCECVAILDEKDERAEIWKQVCPDLRLPLKSPMPIRGKGPDGEIHRFLECDTDRLTDFQKARLAELMAKKFGLDEKQAFNMIQKGELPIKDENITMMICNLHVRCMM